MPKVVFGILQGQPIDTDRVFYGKVSPSRYRPASKHGGADSILSAYSNEGPRDDFEISSGEYA